MRDIARRRGAHRRPSARGPGRAALRPGARALPHHRGRTRATSAGARPSSASTCWAARRDGEVRRPVAPEPRRGGARRYEALLGDLETSFAGHRAQLLEDNRSDLDVEIEVLRERLQQDGLTPADHRERRRCPKRPAPRPRPRSRRPRRSPPTCCPSPKGELSPLDAADPGARRPRSSRRKAEIDMATPSRSSASAPRAQAELQAISQEMLAGVRNKDVGPAGNSLREIVALAARLLRRRARPRPQAAAGGSG